MSSAPSPITHLLSVASQERQGDRKALMHFYHQDVFEYLHKKCEPKVRYALLDAPIKFRFESFLPNFEVDKVFGGEEAWEVCRKYLLELERRIESILSRHSAFFWLHLYRRIGVGLHPEHDGKTDAQTLGLVRQIVELSILKFGSLTETSDMALSTQVGVKKVMGGLYERTIRKKYKKQADFIIRSFQSPSYRQWIVADFGRQDFIDMYAVEGLAYEYWRVTALMRGIGKGDSFRNTGNPWISYEPDAVQAFLIHSYDERIEKVPFSYSRIGSWFHVTQNAPKTAENRIFVPFYNIERRKGGGYLETLGVTGPDFISNFLLGNIDLVAFKQAHLFIAKQFQKATGFTLDSFLSCLWALVMIALIPPEALDDVDETKALDLSVDKPLGQNLLSILQRGYRTVKNDKQQLEQDVLLFGSVARRTFPECTDEGLKAAFNYLTLQDDKRSLIGLWTSGRRFPIIPFGSIVIIDLQGIPPLLNTLFFRIQDQQGLKGTVFEDAFRAALAECGLHLTQRGVIESQTGLEREIDAGVRIGDTLVLMECRAMELPLDFEIGKPRTINARTRMMNEKVDQVLSLRDFIIQNPQGKNYDFSWAREIVALVVSPFVEWIWDRSDRLWLDAETPRIQQADEAIEYLQNMNNKARTA